MDELLTKKRSALEERITKVATDAGGVFRTRYGIGLLAMISFVESALVVPIITDPFIVAYILANRTKAALAFWTATVASVLGGVVAYATAALVIDLLLTNFFSSISPAELQEMAARFEEGTFIVTILGAFTPIPYTVVALAAGSVKASLTMFIIASLLGRGSRYLIVTYLTCRFGDRAMIEVQKRIWPSTILLLILVVLFILYQTL